MTLEPPNKRPALPGAAPAIDAAALERLREDMGQDDATVVQLIELYLKESAELVAGMKPAFDAGDASTLARHAHSLKSTSALLGALGLSKLARELEATAKDGHLEGAAGRISSIRTEHAAASRELESLCQNLRRS